MNAETNVEGCASYLQPTTMLSAPYDGARLTNTFTLQAGERIQFTVSGSPGGAASAALIGGQEPQSIFAGRAPFSATFTAESSSRLTFEYRAGRGVTISARCEGAPASAAAEGVNAQAVDFMRRRADRLLSGETAQTSLQRRAVSPASVDQAVKTTAVRTENGAPTDVTLSTSANAIAKSYANAAQKPMGESKLDFWLEGRASQYKETMEDVTGRQEKMGEVGMLYFGADYLVNPQVMVGALVQLDSMDETFKTGQQQVFGSGFMAGPYASVRLAPNIFFDARAAWGPSANTIAAEDGAEIDFNTGRSLVRGQFVANRNIAGFQLSPNISMAVLDDVITEGSNSADMGSGTVTGRMSLGSALSYRMPLDHGAFIQPRAAVGTGWDVQKFSELTDFEAFSNETGAKVEAGLALGTASGLTMEAAAALEGVGADDFQAWSGRINLKTPLN
ncbi:MAG: autotransporter domain-containing protein [Chitinophagales bacterium]|nr:autotransporter domain-containing protein [Hyphomicrobiales bacterium]